MGFLRASISAAVILTLFVGIDLEARVPAAEDPAGRLEVAAAAMTMDQAVKMAEQRFKARVVRAETQKDGARTVYVLRLLNDAGRVWTVHVDAANGRVQ